ncbi:MAG: HAD family hydrolase [Candidatus Humimicrobiaceae bacterium]
MNRFEMILFDLDGTLVDSKSVIIDSANHMLASFGFKKLDEHEIIEHIKFDTSYLVSSLTGFTDDEQIKKGIFIFGDYWKEHLATDSKLFKGVLSTLEYLKDKELVIISNGIRTVIEEMLDLFKIRSFFKYIISGDEPDCIKPTACPINKVFNNFHIAKKEQTIIVGDTVADIKAGKGAGIKTCAVSYGMGKLKDIKDAEPDYIIDSIIKLKNIVRDK